MPKTIEISHRTILFTIGILVGGWLVLQIRDILFLLFISFILMAALRPIVDRLTIFKIPRVVAILFVYILLIFGVGLLIGSLIPSVASQASGLIQELPNYANKVIPSLNLDMRAITQEIAPLTQNLVRVGVEIFNNILSIVTILVFTFYLLLARSSMNSTLKNLMGENLAEKVYQVLKDVEQRLGAWAIGQVTLMIIIGVLTYIGLTLLGVKYALPLAVFAGLLEIIPMIGPIIGAVPAVLIAFTISPLLAVSVAALYFVIQQFENHLIVPFIMRRSVGLSPIITIIAFMIGARFEGVIGAVLAIPAIVVVRVIINRILELRMKQNESIV